MRLIYRGDAPMPIAITRQTAHGAHPAAGLPPCAHPPSAFQRRHPQEPPAADSALWI